MYIHQTTNPLWLIVFNSCYQVQYSVITLENLWLRSQLYYSSYFLQEDPLYCLSTTHHISHLLVNET
jgi:hypothetical protein